MQNRIIKSGVITFAFTIIASVTYSLWDSNPFDHKTVFLLIQWSIGCSVFVALLYKVLLLRKERALKCLGADLETNETVIIEGPANYCQSYTNVDGKLLLTSDRLIFRTRDHSQDSFSLGQIISIKVKKTLGILEDELIISINGNTEHFGVDYPGDWKNLIEWQKTLNEKIQ